MNYEIETSIGDRRIRVSAPNQKEAVEMFAKVCAPTVIGEIGYAEMKHIQAMLDKAARSPIIFQ